MSTATRRVTQEPSHGERHSLAAAIELYRQLVRGGPVTIGQTDPDALAELLSLGLGRKIGRRVAPVPVNPAMERLLSSGLRDISARQSALRRAYRDLMRLHEAADASLSGEPAAGWQVLAGEEATDLAVEIGRTARRELLDVWTAPAMLADPAPGALGLPTAPARDGLAHRVVCDHRILLTRPGERAVQALRNHAEVRVATGVTACVRIADGEHLLVWPPSAESTAEVTYFQSRAIIAAIRRLFDVLWSAGSAVFRSPRPPELTAAQWRILQLMSSGLSDAALAAATGTAVRTVRAHITAIVNALDTRTRFAAGVEAARRGWV